MAGKKSAPHGIAIIIGQQITVQDAMADVINATAATFAADNYKLFKEWLEERSASTNDIAEQITLEMLLASIARIIARSPEHL